MQLTDSLKSLIWSFLYTGTTLATFSIGGKAPVENEMLNNLNNFNILVGILLDPTDLVESCKDMFCISDLLVGVRKKKVWVLFFKKSGKCLCEGLIFSFVFFLAIVAN